MTAGPSALTSSHPTPVSLQLNSTSSVSLPHGAPGKLFVPGLVVFGPLSFAHAPLLDSGADGNFIDPKLVSAWNIPTVPVSVPIVLHLADGLQSSGGTITHQTVPVQLHLGSHVETLTFFVTPVAHGMILGYPWLFKHNPTIDWHRHTLVFGSPSCLESCNAMASEITGFPAPSGSTHPSLGSNAGPSESSVMAASIDTDVNLATDCDSPSFYAQYIRSYLTDFSDVFSKTNATALPPHRSFDCDIPLQPDAKIPHGKVYSLTEQETSVMESYIKDNLAAGFIRPSQSPASAPCFFVKKKDSSLRLCVDYRKLNEVTVKNRYPLPLISDLIRTLHSAKHFTALDLRNGYHLVRVKEGDEWKTAFNTQFGLFEYLVMPFGLANAPSIFQEMMNTIFHDVLNKFVVIYLDDILIFSDSPAQHDQHVRYVLEKLRSHNLFCKPEKCQFFQSSISYLGFVISDKGVNMDPTKVSAITSWPEPTSVKELQQFLGFANFYRRFIANFAGIAKPLTSLTRKHRSFVWGPEQQQAFQQLLSQFQNASWLAIADTTKPFIVETDASDFALGGVLSQYDTNNVLRPVAFHSRQFTSAELNYEIYDKELLAIHACFKEWRHFLQGARHPITVFCDHKNLAYYKDPHQLTRRQARWALFFAEFDFIIKHRRGIDNTKADLLSRRQDYDDNTSKMSPPWSQLFKTNPNDPETLQPTQVLKSDLPAPTPTVSINLVDAHAPLATGDLLHKIKIATSENKVPNACVLQHGIAYFGQRIYVPTDQLRLLVLLLRHDSASSGHFGIKKTTDLVARDFWWPGLASFVKKYVKSCHCSQFKSTRAQPVGELHPLPVPTRPWGDISTDFIVGLPPCMGYNAISVWVCRLTKMAHFVPCSSNVTASDTASIFLHNVFSYMAYLHLSFLIEVLSLFRSFGLSFAPHSISTSLYLLHTILNRMVRQNGQIKPSNNIFVALCPCIRTIGLLYLLLLSLHTIIRNMHPLTCLHFMQIMVSILVPTISPKCLLSLHMTS